MLKIKEEVDLKELEKFGFEYKENKKHPLNSFWEYKGWIKIQGSKEQVYIRAFDKREIWIHSDCGMVLDKLYDLIQAGLVEKVEG